MSSEHWDLDARRVHAGLSRLATHREKRRAESLLRLIYRNATAGGAVLDAGMGDGGLVVELSRRGFACVGVDISAERVATAGERISQAGTSAALRQESVSELSAQTATFDTAVCSEVLEHLASPESALLELARVVRPGGTLVVSVPWDENLTFDVCPHCGTSVFTHGHIRSFTPDSLSGMVAAAGFETPQTFGLGSGPLLRGPFLPIAWSLPAALWRAADSVARRMFKPEWIVVVAKRQDPSTR